MSGLNPIEAIHTLEIEVIYKGHVASLIHMTATLDHVVIHITLLHACSCAPAWLGTLGDRQK